LKERCQIVRKFTDLDGSTEDVENVRIILDGANFEIDLRVMNINQLNDITADVIEAARETLIVGT